jgi:hypothetical protein
MAIPTITAIGAYSFGTGPLTPALPAGVLVGMLLLLEVETSANETVAVSGWTQVPDSPVNNANGTRLAVFYRYATGSGDDPTVPDSGDHQSARVIVLNGTHATVPIDVSASSTGDTAAVSISGDTTTGVDRLVLIFASQAINQPDYFAGWANADLTSVTEQFDVAHGAGNSGGIALVSGSKAVAGAFGATTATGTEDTAWSGLVLAIVPGTPIVDAGGGSSEESSEEGSSEEDPVFGDVGFDTWQFDTPEPLKADRDPIDYFLAYQMMDNGSENRDKKIDTIRITGKGKSIAVQIHAASPGDALSRQNIEDGVSPRHTTTFADSTEVTRYKEKKVKIKNLSIWTARYSGTDDGQDEDANGELVRDRLDELVILGDTHGTRR